MPGSCEIVLKGKLRVKSLHDARPMGQRDTAGALGCLDREEYLRSTRTHAQHTHTHRQHHTYTQSQHTHARTHAHTREANPGKGTSWVEKKISGQHATAQTQTHTRTHARTHAHTRLTRGKGHSHVQRGVPVVVAVPRLLVAPPATPWPRGRERCCPAPARLRPHPAIDKGLG